MFDASATNVRDGPHKSFQFRTNVDYEKIMWNINAGEASSSSQNRNKLIIVELSHGEWEYYISRYSRNIPIQHNTYVPNHLNSCLRSFQRIEKEIIELSIYLFWHTLVHFFSILCSSQAYDKIDVLQFRIAMFVRHNIP